MISEADWTRSFWERGEVTQMVSLQGINLLRATAFGHLGASEELVESLAI